MGLSWFDVVDFPVSLPTGKLLCFFFLSLAGVRVLF